MNPIDTAWRVLKTHDKDTGEEYVAHSEEPLDQPTGEPCINECGRERAPREWSCLECIQDSRANQGELSWYCMHCPPESEPYKVEQLPPNDPHGDISEWGECPEHKGMGDN